MISGLKGVSSGNRILAVRNTETVCHKILVRPFYSHERAAAFARNQHTLRASTSHRRRRYPSYKFHFASIYQRIYESFPMSEAGKAEFPVRREIMLIIQRRLRIRIRRVRKISRRRHKYPHIKKIYRN